MARSTARSLADRTVSAVRTVVGRRGPTESAAPADPKAVVKKVAAKKAPVAKKPAAKKPAAKKPAAKKPAAKRPAAKKPAAKRPAAKKPAAKKPAAKKPAPGKTAAALPVQSGESAWTSVELAEVVDDLRSQRDHALAVMAAQSDQLSGLMRDAGDGAGQDQADVGSTTFERDQELTILSSERDKLTQIDRALTRIDDGSYGSCEGCEEPIGKMRLMAFPRATLCMTCKQREERR